MGWRERPRYSAVDPATHCPAPQQGGLRKVDIGEAIGSLGPAKTASIRLTHRWTQTAPATFHTYTTV